MTYEKLYKELKLFLEEQKIFDDFKDCIIRYSDFDSYSDFINYFVNQKISDGEAVSKAFIWVRDKKTNNRWASISREWRLYVKLGFKKIKTVEYKSIW